MVEGSERVSPVKPWESCNVCGGMGTLAEIRIDNKLESIPCKKCEGIGKVPHEDNELRPTKAEIAADRAWELFKP
jgi:DnaJ-class molecular chaperone